MELIACLHFDMKFGKNLSDLSIPEWKRYNLDYNDLKAEIKLYVAGETRLSSLQQKFLDNFNVINLFLKTKYGEIYRKFNYYENNFAQLLREINTENDTTVKNVHLIKLDILLSNLIELSIMLKKLSKFILIQKIAVKKIFKKFLKKHPTAKSEKFILNLKLYLNKNADSFINLNLVNLTIKLTNLINLIKFEINKLNNDDLEFDYDNDFDILNFNNLSASVSSLPLSLNMKFDYNIFLKKNFHLPFLLPDDTNNFNQILLNLDIYLDFKKLNKVDSLNSLIYLQNSTLTHGNNDGRNGGSSGASGVPNNHDHTASSTGVISEPSFILSEYSLPLSLIVCYIGGLRKYSYCFLSNSIVNLILDYLQDPSNKLLKSQMKNCYQTNNFNSLTRLTIETLLNNHLTPKVKIYYKSLRYYLDQNIEDFNNGTSSGNNIQHDNDYLLHLNHDIYSTDSLNHICTTKFLIPKQFRVVESETATESADGKKSGSIDGDQMDDEDDEVDSSIYLELDKFPFNTLNIYSNDINLLNFEKTLLSEIDDNLLSNKFSNTLLNRLPPTIQLLIKNNHSLNLFQSFNMYHYCLSCYYNVIPSNLNNHFSNLLNLNLFKNYENIEKFNQDLNLDSNIIKHNSDKILQNKNSLNDLKFRQRREQKRNQYQRYIQQYKQQLRQKQLFEPTNKPKLMKKDSLQSITSLNLSIFTSDRLKSNNDRLDELVALEDNESLRSFWKDLPDISTSNNEYPRIRGGYYQHGNNLSTHANNSSQNSFFLGDFNFVTNIMRLKDQMAKKTTPKSSFKSTILSGHTGGYQSINDNHTDDPSLNEFSSSNNTNDQNLLYGTSTNLSSDEEAELDYYTQFYNYSYEYDKIITFFHVTLSFVSIFISGIELGILFSLFKLGRDNNNFKMVLNLWLLFVLIVGLFISFVCSTLSAILLSRKRFPVKFWHMSVAMLEFMLITACSIFCVVIFSS